MPQRITTSLTARRGKRYHPLWISIHFTHPDQLTRVTVEACARLADAGIRWEARPCCSGLIVSTESLMPERSTVWLPSGMPASASRAQASTVSGVSSIRVGEVDAHPEGMVALQDPGEGDGDALRHHHRSLGADPQELHVGNPVQPGEQPVELLLRQRRGGRRRRAARRDLGVGLDVGDGLFPLGLEEDAVVVGVLHHARPRAVAAVGGAGVRHEEQHPVGIAVHDAGPGCPCPRPEDLRPPRE